MASFSTSGSCVFSAYRLQSLIGPKMMQESYTSPVRGLQRLSASVADRTRRTARTRTTRDAPSLQRLSASVADRTAYLAGWLTGRR